MGHRHLNRPARRCQIKKRFYFGMGFAKYIVASLVFLKKRFYFGVGFGISAAAT